MERPTARGEDHGWPWEKSASALNPQRMTAAILDLVPRQKDK